MNKKWLSLYAKIGFMFILLIETTRASLSPSQHSSVPTSESKTEEKSDDFKQRSDGIISLGEHLKINNLLHKHLDSNERLLNKQLTFNLHNPELNFNKKLRSELFTDKQLSFNSGGNFNLGKGHPSVLSFSHLISPHLKDDDFETDGPSLGPELAQKYQRELHETLNTHRQNLQQALQNKHENLQHAMNKHHIQNAQNFNLNKYDEQSSISSGPNEETLYQNEHITYNHENNKPQNENAYISPPSNSIPSIGEQVHGYQGGHSPVINNDYEMPNNNNGHTHSNVYVKTEEPHVGVKSHAYGSKEYFYENQKVHKPVSHVNHHTGYGIGEKEGNVGNSNSNSEYPSNAYQGGKEYNHNHNIRPNQYDMNPNLNRNKNQYEAVPQKYQNNKNQFQQTNHATNDGGYNNNYQSGNNYAQERPVHINKNNAQTYGPNPYQGNNNQNQHSYSGNAEAVNNKYGKTGNMYNQEYGSEGSTNKGRPNPNYNQNSGIKNNSPEVYSSNNGYNNNGNKYYDSHSLNHNSGHVNGYNQNYQGNSQGLPKNYNPNPIQQKQVFTEGQNYNNKVINNEMYYNGKSQNGYNRGSPVDDRKRYNVPMHQAKSHTDKGYYNNNLPQQPNINNHNGKHLHNSTPFVPPNKSPYAKTGQSYPSSKSNNQNSVRPYSALNQNTGHQMYPNNFDANKGSPNPREIHSNSPGNSSNRGGYQNSSYLRRKETPLKVPAFSPNAKTSKVLTAPIIHQIYMSEPLIKEDMFLASMF